MRATNIPVLKSRKAADTVLASAPPSENVLLLGMVYSKRATNPARGQEFRDRVRCEALSKLGYSVKTLDDKHEDESDENLHCQTNFSDPRRMISSMQTLWKNNDCKFDHIILDYFFSPVGWARTRWSERFYKETLPALARGELFNHNGKIWLPRIQCVEECILENSTIIQDHFVIDMIEDPLENPLFRATAKVREQLEKCPDKLSNDNQIVPLLEYSKKPFFCLTFYNSIPSSPSSPMKRKYTSSSSSSCDVIPPKTSSNNIISSTKSTIKATSKPTQTPISSSKANIILKTLKEEPPPPPAKPPPVPSAAKKHPRAIPGNTVPVTTNSQKTTSSKRRRL